MTLDLTKPVQTRAGRRVRIYATDGSGIQPVHGAVWLDCQGEWRPHQWCCCGAYVRPDLRHDWDLINVPPPTLTVDMWLNVYAQESCLHASRASADNWTQPGRIACLHIVQGYAEGEGL